MSTVIFPLGGLSYQVVGMSFTAKSLFMNAAFKQDAEAFDLNKSLKKTGSDGVYADRSSGNPNKSSFVFSTSYAKLWVEALTSDRRTPAWFHMPTCDLYHLKYPGNIQVNPGIVRLNREWRESQAEVLDFDVIVIRVTPSEMFEPWQHSSFKPSPSRSPPPAD
ncbi:hypothetical protein CC78DRAFT_619853 [Lojkania enalia]|uniref:Uncharacterized protein n=1 Tax=Lojkania enalia TaxID=147567 RepID=A0A9P4K2X0_9PLEO|nr:hypothetical protein CC78DRAFT_619853 [Didymosphaeria enalia]